MEHASDGNVANCGRTDAARDLRAYTRSEDLMPVPLVLTFVSTVAFAIQLLIFAYLYSSHRVRFFQYLLLAWGAYTLSKGLKLVDVLVFNLEEPSIGTGVATVAAVGFMLAAAFAYRWNYRLRGRDLVIGSAVAVVLAIANDVGSADEGLRLVGVGLGAAQMVAGALFWPSRDRVAGVRVRGERLLAGLLTLWGIHRIATQFVSAPPGSAAYLSVHAVFITLYFLSTFAVIIMVLERARSESERLTARLSEAERLATTGELAAGMAHEIRNPLAAIVNATALLTDEAGLTVDERAATVAAIRAEARRLNRILSDFLRFARPQQVQLAPGDIREVVQHVSALIRDDRSRAPRVDVKVAVDPAVPRFAFDRDQMTQVLWNVALNGVQAMNGRGRLSVEVGREVGHVALAVSDTGPGIPREVLPRVFEPFYSGKPNGSGLGLTIAERIVAAHGGRIEIDSAPGGGTRVRMLFPVEAA
jgi:signal transduction histidine kinase